MVDLAAALGSIATKVSVALGGPYHSAQIVLPAAIGERPDYAECMAQVDAATEGMRSAADFTEEDRRILVLRSGLDAEITSDCRLRILAGPYAGSVWNIVPPVMGDSVAAYVELHARPRG